MNLSAQARTDDTDTQAFPCGRHGASTKSSGKRAEAEAWNAQLSAACDFLGVESNPIPIKALLARLGIGHGLRLPLLSLSSAHEGTAATIAQRVRELEQDSHDAFVV